mgnify:CR=1 FL=1
MLHNGRNQPNKKGIKKIGKKKLHRRLIFSFRFIKFVKDLTLLTFAECHKRPTFYG